MSFSTDKAFSRNRGLISDHEQQRLLTQLVVIPGCGGIGSTVAETLARLGVGRFRLCDPDTFDVANFNRQLGATLTTVGQNKAEAVAERIWQINPEAQIEIVNQPVSRDNASDFVAGASLVLDGLDFFALTARRALFKAASDTGIPAMTAAPLGFSGTLQVFLPDRGLSFDRFYDFRAEDSSAEQVIKFLVGLSPAGLHRPYMDFSRVSIQDKNGPSSILGTQMAASLIGGQALQLLLNRQAVRSAPWCLQMDVYRQKAVRRFVPGGNRFPLQKLKIALVRRAFRQNGLLGAMADLKLG
ncbi:ThiF family adenylyltransferase [Reinekea blandensis]|uniref:THIF-type NAD/FAD binding fold domain-containing protein n=1 Tax=Reinekea blandensis MED297 TaxID=314283 RepID=A4BFV3_9GAMM|nr:ThiF family adenylyltransferase [Reinekea blandensis]EAR08971.1 hypothetical protein MED297_03742 [Reinekea sp. MED297] [Reinekea blandensis MED297]